MKIACVLITHLSAKAELQRHVGLRKKPVIITARSIRGPLVLDISPQVTGVVAGMPVQEALSRCKGVVLLEADEPHYRMVFEKIIEALSQRSPLVEKAELGCAYVEVGGLEDMYGGEPNIMSALLNAVPVEFNARAGLARTKFPAYVAAVMSDGGEATRVPNDVPGFLTNLPVDLLPISWDNKVRLRRLGLYTIGQVASLSVGHLQAQFGAEGRVAWELANGIDRSWLTAYKQEQLVSESLTFPSPATTLHAILPAVEALLGRAFSHPLVKGRYVRSASIEAQIMRRPPWTKRFAFNGALNSKHKAFPALRAMLETAEIPGPLEDMRLTLSGITGEPGIQSSLFLDVRRQAQLREAMRQLETRLRTKPPIYKVMDVAAMVKTARKKARPDSIRALNLPELVDVEEDEHRRPVSLTFRSRRLKVVSIEGTWEVVDEWWRPNSVARRYYKVVLKDGSGLTIFRNLLRDRWYEQQD